MYAVVNWVSGKTYHHEDREKALMAAQNVTLNTGVTAGIFEIPDDSELGKYRIPRQRPHDLQD